MTRIYHPVLDTETVVPWSCASVLARTSGWRLTGPPPAEARPWELDALEAAGALAPVPDVAPDVPPSGNASTDEWRTYAQGLGFDVPEDARRDAIKDLVTGLP